MNHEQLANKIWNHLENKNTSTEPLMIVDDYLQGNASFVKRRFYGLSGNVIEVFRSWQKGILYEEGFTQLKGYYQELISDFSTDLIAEQSLFDLTKAEEAKRKIESWDEVLTKENIHNAPIAEIESYFDNFFSSQKPLFDTFNNNFPHPESLIFPSHEETLAYYSKYRNNLFGILDQLKKEVITLSSGLEYFSKPVVKRILYIIASGSLGKAFDSASEITFIRHQSRKKLYWLNYNFDLLKKELILGFTSRNQFLNKRLKITNQFVDFLHDDIQFT